MSATVVVVDPAWRRASASMGPAMKIAKIETHVCHARMRNWIFVKVLTDQPGLFGWGEATLEWHTRGVVGAIEDLAELLVGEDPTRIEHLWQMMYRQHFWHGHGIVRATAIARHRHRPVGHPRQGRTACRATSCGAGRCATTSAPTATWAAGGWRTFTRRRPTTPTRFADLARQAVADGLHRVQVDGRAADDADRRARADSLRRSVPCAAMREAVGDAIDIMVDCHARPSPRDGAAVRQGARAVRAVLPRRALLAGERRRPGGDQRAP